MIQYCKRNKRSVFGSAVFPLSVEKYDENSILDEIEPEVSVLERGVTKKAKKGEQKVDLMQEPA